MYYIRYAPSCTPALHRLCPGSSFLTWQGFRSNSLEPQSHHVTIMASEREEMKSLPRPSWLRLLLLRAKNRAAAPSSFSKMTISMVSVRLRTGFTKFNVKDEVEHMVFLSALRRGAGSSKCHPNQEQRQGRAQTLQGVFVYCFKDTGRFNSCFNEHM